MTLLGERGEGLAGYLDPSRGGVKVQGAQGRDLQRWRPGTGIYSYHGCVGNTLEGSGKYKQSEQMDYSGEDFKSQSNEPVPGGPKREVESGSCQRYT